MRAHCNQLFSQLVTVAAVSALPDGAPLDACVKGNKPNHSKIPAQPADSNPYRIVASTSQYQAGSTITGKLAPPSDMSYLAAELAPSSDHDDQDACGERRGG